MSKKGIIVILVILILSALSILTVFIIKNNKRKNIKNIAISYLNTKYGDGEWKITNIEDYIYENTEEILFKQDYIKDGYILTISSSYINNNLFHLYINDCDMVTTDCFLPTYYSMKYNLDYHEDNFLKLIERMTYVTEYHYPYRDFEFESTNWKTEPAKRVINTFLMSAFYDPIAVSTSPTKEKVLDIIPNNGKIPEIKEIIELVEEYYSKDRLRNKDNNEKEFYDLVFQNDTSEEEIVNFISKHITKVPGIEVSYEYE